MLIATVVVVVILLAIYIILCAYPSMGGYTNIHSLVFERVTGVWPHITRAQSVVVSLTEHAVSVETMPFLAPSVMLVNKEGSGTLTCTLKFRGNDLYHGESRATKAYMDAYWEMQG